MTQKSADMLLNVIYPILKSVIPRTARPIGSEDPEELIADSTASAVEMIESMEASGREPSLDAVHTGTKGWI
jgi:hypothetical protein